MPEKSSDSPTGPTQGIKMSTPRLLAMLFLNALPLAHLGAVIATATLLPTDWGTRLTVTLTVLYLLPPLLARPFLPTCRSAGNHAPLGSPPFFAWWVTLQLQMVFNRLTFLEEILRFVPGLYSFWLRLWGAKVGARTFWASGVTILDRPFLRIGNGVVFGAGVRINPHVIAAPDDASEKQLLLADVVIGDACTVGGYSLLTAGPELAPGETTRAFLISSPFSLWQNGRRQRDSARRERNHVSKTTTKSP